MSLSSGEPWEARGLGVTSLAGMEPLREVAGEGAWAVGWGLTPPQPGHDPGSPSSSLTLGFPVCEMGAIKGSEFRQEEACARLSTPAPRGAAGTAVALVIRGCAGLEGLGARLETPTHRGRPPAEATRGRAAWGHQACHPAGAGPAPALDLWLSLGGPEPAPVACPLSVSPHLCLPSHATRLASPAGSPVICLPPSGGWSLAARTGVAA